MGTDELGRDTFSRMLSGTRVSMIVGLGSVAIGLLIGAPLGMAAGIRPGEWLDSLIMRLMDIILSFPLIVLAAVVSGITVGQTLHVGPVPISQITVITFVLGFVLVPVFARIARASVLAEIGEEYIVAARVSGARWRQLLLKHLLPNIQAPLLVQCAFAVCISIIVEASLSFIGLGVQPPQASWGNILADGQQQILLGAWWLIAFPTLAIAIVTLCFTIVGDGIRDLLDPRAQQVPGKTTIGIAAVGVPAAGGVVQ